MHPFILPGVLIATGVAALFRDHKNLLAPAPEGPRLADLILTTHRNGSAVVSLKPEVAQALLGMLHTVVLEEEALTGNAEGRTLYRVVSGKSDVTAAQVAVAAQAQGFCVLASTSLVDLASSSGAPAYLLCCRPQDRKLANPQGQLALLLDAPDPAPVEEAPAVAPAPAPAPEPEVVAGAPEAEPAAEASAPAAEAAPPKAAKKRSVKKPASPQKAKKPTKKTPAPKKLDKTLNGASTRIAIEPISAAHPPTPPAE